MKEDERQVREESRVPHDLVPRNMEYRISALEEENKRLKNRVKYLESWREDMKAEVVRIANEEIHAMLQEVLKGAKGEPLELPKTEDKGE